MGEWYLNICSDRRRPRLPGRLDLVRCEPNCRQLWLAGAFVLLLPACSGCGPGAAGTSSSFPVSPAPRESAGNAGGQHNGRIVLADRTAESRVRFTYRNGEESGHYSILESMGGGAALLDYDGDGRLDLFAPGGGEIRSSTRIVGRAPALFRNLDAWEFQPVTAAAAVEHAPHYSHGAAAGDYDNDGFCDLVVTGYGGLVLWHNLGDGTFAAVTAVAGLHDALWSITPAWGDVDGDGSLDLYVAHYVDWSFENHPACLGPPPENRDICPPREFNPLPDVLYRNLQDGTFLDASREFGLRPDGKGIGVVIADVDLDGDVDIYVGNDTVANFLYRNDGGKRLEEVGLSSGTALSDVGMPDGSMGVDVGDFNGDGRFDLWVANYERESFALYRNEGEFFFQHVSQITGVTAVGALFVGWGTVFADFDRDGDEDVFASNGHVVRHPTNAPLRQLPLLFENDGGRRLRNVAPAAGPYLRDAHRGRGVAAGDVDDDGDWDLVVSHVNEPLALLSNESTNGHHWVSLRLVGTRSNRDAVGAVVTVHTSQGTQVRQVKGGGSYASTNDRRVFFGLGTASEVERITIRWPSGHAQELLQAPSDRVLTIIEPQG